MGRIENYDNDSGISSLDRLFGTSYEGMLDGRPVYKTKNYLMGELISKISSEVASAGDRWDSISYKFTPQMVYDLGDPNSDVLDLYSSGDNHVKWIMLPGIPNKILIVSNAIYFIKKGTTNFDVNYNIYFASKRANNSLAYEFSINTVEANFTEDYFKCASGGLFSGLEYKVGEPLLLDVYAASIASQGDGEFGIFLEYKYFDFNLDFNG